MKITTKKIKDTNRLLIPPYRVRIEFEGMDVYINLMELNCIQRFLLRLLGIKVKRLKGGK